MDRQDPDVVESDEAEAKAEPSSPVSSSSAPIDIHQPFSRLIFSSPANSFIPEAQSQNSHPHHSLLPLTDSFRLDAAVDDQALGVADTSTTPTPQSQHFSGYDNQYHLEDDCFAEEMIFSMDLPSDEEQASEPTEASAEAQQPVRSISHPLPGAPLHVGSLSHHPQMTLSQSLNEQAFHSRSSADTARAQRDIRAILDAESPPEQLTIFKLMQDQSRQTKVTDDSDLTDGSVGLADLGASLDVDDSPFRRKTPPK